MTKGKKIEIKTDADAETDAPQADAEGAKTDPVSPATHPDEPAAEVAPDPDPAPEHEAEDRLSAAEQEARENYDRFLRVSAEFDNFKKRAAREREEYRKFATESLIKELLPVVDNLERAVSSAGSLHSDDHAFVEGVTLTLQEILRVLGKFGVEPIEALHTLFDPAYHQAMMQQERDDVPENTVITELQKGYTLHDRLLRPSMVVVSVQKASEENRSDDADRTAK